MSRIEYVSHHPIPNDEFKKEIVYICIDKQFRVAYVHKCKKDGGSFWSVMTTNATVNGQITYFDSFIPDSKFLENDILEFLNKRKWESQKHQESEKIHYPHGLCQNSYVTHASFGTQTPEPNDLFP